MTPATQSAEQAQAERSEMIGRHLRFPKRNLTSDEMATLADLLGRADLATLREVQSTLPDLFVAAAPR